MEHEKYFFQKLTPANDIDISVYEEAIDYIFENKDIKNVAISGAYSAGKSSVLESYKEKHKKLKFIHISLAHFRSAAEEANEENIKESVLEGKILNQLIHQIPVERIPQTNFRVKKDTGEKEIYLITTLLCLLIGSIIFLLFSSRISEFIYDLPENIIKCFLLYLTGKYAVIIAALIFAVCGIICIYNVVKVQRNKNIFHKISIQGNDIEIFESQEDSYFDKYLNEVLYLFEQIDADVIVFEDMDRFNINSIFERLREVNNLINIRKENALKASKSNQYMPLKFFYLLRDDIFVTKDRTKFFDYIVPIVPVLDGSNSYDQFIKHLKQGNIFGKFDESFLQRLSLYIDDMRILKNVYNEFIVYIYRLDSTDLNWNKMLAMIVYKNLFPRDFSNLQLAKGYVYELFEQKDDIRKNMIVQFEEEKNEILASIDRIKTETLNSTQELDDAYHAKYERLETNYRWNRTKEYKQRKNELENEKNLRKKAIEDRGAGALASREKEVLEIEQKITRTKNCLLNELVMRDNADSIFMISSINPIGEKEEYREIKSSDYFELLKFLIRYGYIDETYNDYMTYFYEESLTVNDKTFLRRITDKRGADYGYVIKEVQKVITSPILRIVDFNEEETLNFELLRGLLVNQEIPKYREYLSALIEQIKNKKQVDFVSKFYDSDKFVDRFIVKLNEQWPDFFSYVTSNKAMPSEQIKKYSLDTLYLSNEQVIRKMNTDNCLSDYISCQSDYLDIQNPNINKIIEQFGILEVSFETINVDKANRELFDEVYANDFYELTFENVRLMLSTQYNISNAYDIVHRNYTLTQNMPDSALSEYVSWNMEIYLKEVLSNCGERIEDDEFKALDIINNNSIDNDTKVQYIDYLKCIISDITKVNDSELWGELIKNEIVESSVSNVICYFQKYGLDKELVGFINRLDIDTDFTGVAEKFGDEVAEKFFDSISVNNDIETNKYKKILNDLGYIFDKYDEKEITDEKIQILIENQIIQMNKQSLEFIRSKCREQIMYFIQYNIEEYLGLQTVKDFVYEEAIKVLEFDLEDAKKIKLIRYTDKPISVLNKSFSDKLFTHILDNNFDENDAAYLFHNYSDYSEAKQDAIYQIAVERINDIIEKSIVLDDRLLSDILIKSNRAKNVKIALWSKAIPNMNEESCIKHFRELELPELKGIFTKRNNTARSYVKNDYVTAIFKALKENTWIYDYYESESDSGRYIVVKNKPKKVEK